MSPAHNAMHCAHEVEGIAIGTGLAAPTLAILGEAARQAAIS
jgi:hypothetical protein